MAVRLAKACSRGPSVDTLAPPARNAPRASPRCEPTMWTMDPNRDGVMRRLWNMSANIDETHKHPARTSARRPSEPSTLETWGFLADRVTKASAGPSSPTIPQAACRSRTPCQAGASLVVDTQTADDAVSMVVRRQVGLYNVSFTHHKTRPRQDIARRTSTKTPELHLYPTCADGSRALPDYRDAAEHCLAGQSRERWPGRVPVPCILWRS